MLCYFFPSFDPNGFESASVFTGVLEVRNEEVLLLLLGVVLNLDVHRLRGGCLGFQGVFNEVFVLFLQRVGTRRQMSKTNLPWGRLGSDQVVVVNDAFQEVVPLLKLVRYLLILHISKSNWHPADLKSLIIQN